ncbi:hypothetical protein [Caldicoprobacter algeriensis]|nr:hypothetical protein [Caldicoprobacter algeriensis]
MWVIKSSLRAAFCLVLLQCGKTSKAIMGGIVQTVEFKIAAVV